MGSSQESSRVITAREKRISKTRLFLSAEGEA